ncbi:phosphatidate cytidylyltransferase [bacterium]|nr:phosphatidate cytidylyltransferase [bacterium]
MTPKESKLKNFLLRSAVGIGWAAVFIFCAWNGSSWRWAVLATVLAVGSIFELKKLLTPIMGKPFLLAAVAGVLAALGGAWLFGAEGLLLGLLAGTLLSLIGVVRIEAKEAGRLPATFFVTLYLALGFGATLLFPAEIATEGRLLLVIATLWIADTGAYLVGSLIGKHKLVPRLSPKKSWEGLIGSILLAAVGSWVLDRWLLDSQLGTEFALSLGVVVALVGLVGDLVISALKRKAEVKDTGTLLPGHGGLLDRLDGFVLVMPTVWLLLRLVEM